MCHFGNSGKVFAKGRDFRQKGRIGDAVGMATVERVVGIGDAGEIRIDEFSGLSVRGPKFEVIDGVVVQLETNNNDIV